MGGELYFLKVLGALGFVLALMWLGSKIFNRITPLGRVPKNKNLKIIEMLSLDTQNRLLVVECYGKSHLLAVGSHGVNVLEKDLPGQ